MGWRDGSVKSTSCSSRSPRFNSQQLHGGSQPAIMGSNALFWHADRALLYINKSLKKNLRNWYASFLKASSVSKYALQSCLSQKWQRVPSKTVLASAQTSIRCTVHAQKNSSLSIAVGEKCIQGLSQPRAIKTGALRGLFRRAKHSPHVAVCDPLSFPAQIPGSFS